MEEVPGAANSLQEAGIFRVGLDFFAQTADANVNAARRYERFAAPDSGEKFFASENAAGMRGQMIEKAEFEEAGGNESVRTRDAIQAEIDEQIIEFQLLMPFWSRFGPPEKKFHTGNEFARAERLGDIVVGAGFEGGDKIGFAAAGRKNNDGQAVKQVIQAEFGKNPQPGNAGEHGVEEQEMWGILFDGGEA